MWILTEDGKEVWTGDGSGRVLVEARQRLIQKVKDEVRSEIYDEMWKANLDEREREQRERKKKKRLEKEKQQQLEKKQRLAKEKTEERRRQKALLHSGKGMPAIWVPVKFKCCPACGGVIDHVEMSLRDEDCAVWVTYACNGNKNSQIKVIASSHYSKGARVPGRTILDVKIEQRCRALENRITKAALGLLDPGEGKK